MNASEDAKNIIKDIIEKHNFGINSKIIFTDGSGSGDGYSSKYVTVEVTGREGSNYFFTKCGFEVKDDSAMPLKAMYENEIYFYDVVYPTCLKFAKEKGFDTNLKMVPKCYGTSPKHIVVLENLKMEGFELFDRKEIMNEDHMLAVLKSLANYHAIMFALKDQNKKEYDELADGVQAFLDFEKRRLLMEGLFKGPINSFISKLDPVEDKYILDKCENLTDRVWNQLIRSSSMKDQYSIITKGDCWTNNTMFRYENENREKPSDVMLIDWQLLTEGSIVIDLSYVFYTIACNEELTRLEFYLKSYHEELAKDIRELGSDPEVVYPYSVLEKEWKIHCVYGYAMAFSVFRIMLLDKEDAPSFVEMDMENINVNEMTPLKDDTEYIKRLKNIILHLMENDLLP